MEWNGWNEGQWNGKWNGMDRFIPADQSGGPKGW